MAFFTKHHGQQCHRIGQHNPHSHENVHFWHCNPVGVDLFYSISAARLDLRMVWHLRERLSEATKIFAASRCRD